MKTKVNNSEFYSIDNLINDCCEATDISLNEITSPYRGAETRITRQVIMYIINNNFFNTLSDIGARFNRDHATVINSVTKVTGYLQTKDHETEQIYKKCFDATFEGIKSNHIHFKQMMKKKNRSIYVKVETKDNACPNCGYVHIEELMPLV